MINTLVVDDERMIRLGIKAMLERRFTDFQIHVASDGKEALDVLQDSQIDIVITDIKMPRVDGIQLIEQMQDMESPPIVIILSGYDDFTYAKKAIKYQVLDYLLKPIDRNELFRVMEDAQKKLDTNRTKIKDLDEYRSNQLNYMLLNPMIQEEQVEKIVEKFQLKAYPDGYYIGIFQPGIQKGDLGKEKVLQEIKKQVEENDVDAFTFIDSEENVIALTESVDMFEQMVNGESVNIDFALPVGISDKHQSMGKLKEAYEQANKALAYHFLYPKQLIFTYRQVEDKKDEANINEQGLQRIYNMLGTDRDNEIKALLLEVFHIEALKEYKLTYVYRLSEAINTIIFDQAFNQLGTESIEIFKQYDTVGDINHFDNIYDYFYAVEDLTLRIHHYMKEIKVVYSEASIMEKAIAFIRENAHKDLNMAVVSNQISLNYSYFSHAFKDYTGENFVDFLKKVRIEKAKELLRDMDKRIFEVSELAGFNNPKQFSRVFRDLEGISPKEYREKL